jgi:hypothetical protein
VDAERRRLPEALIRCGIVALLCLQLHVLLTIIPHRFVQQLMLEWLSVLFPNRSP